MHYYEKDLNVLCNRTFILYQISEITSFQSVFLRVYLDVKHFFRIFLPAVYKRKMIELVRLVMGAFKNGAFVLSVVDFSGNKFVKEVSNQNEVAEGMSLSLIILIIVLTMIGCFVIYKLIMHRIKIQRKVLEKKVLLRTSEITDQKQELLSQSEELHKAYEEIQTKNHAIEEAFEHLSNSYSKLSDLNREKDGMMSIVAHDLRTPLNNIEGLIQLVSMDDNLTEEQQEYISTIRTVVKRGNQMIQDLLDINQSRKAKNKLDISAVVLTDFIQRWQSNFDKQLESKDQRLKVDGDFEDLIIHTDTGILSRILDNILSNAIKFSERGKSIHLNLVSIEDSLKITLRDEGPGISEKDQQKMFKPFTQLSARPTEGEPSNGLGLSIIQSLTRRLGGKIEVESELEKGTSFIISIPKNIEPTMVKS